MTKKKSEQKYLVLVTITNKKTGMEFQPGSHIKMGDFSAKVIKNWLEIKPPVLVEIKEVETVSFANPAKLPVLIEAKDDRDIPDKNKKGKEVADG